nr:unnamed protein product [Digitaria exilis]
MAFQHMPGRSLWLRACSIVLVGSKKFMKPHEFGRITPRFGSRLSVSILRFFRHGATWSSLSRYPGGEEVPPVKRALVYHIQLVVRPEDALVWTCLHFPAAAHHHPTAVLHRTGVDTTTTTQEPIGGVVRLFRRQHQALPLHVSCMVDLVRQVMGWDCMRPAKST